MNNFKSVKFKINGVEYPIQDNVIIEDKSSEDLDTFIVTIPNQEKLDLSTLDECELVINPNTYPYEKTYTPVVNAYNETTVSFNPMKYTYQVSLISETIKLQKIALPNLKITKRRENPITMKRKIEQYYEVYIKPQYPELKISDALLQLTNVECPEKMWNRPNMWEVLNDLLIHFNSVVTINNHIITYKRLDTKNKAIDTSKLSLENNTQNINDYGNKLDIEINNGISSKTTSSVTGTSQRCETSAVLTEDNAQIVLDKPIYKINNAQLFVKNNINPEVQKFFQIDITQYIVEDAVYGTYKSTSKLNDQLADDTYIDYKRLALHYSQGSNTIDGLGFNEALLIGSSYTALATIVYREIKKWYGVEVANGVIKNNDSREWMFEITYEPIDEFRINLVKDAKHNATLIDNQQDSYVNVEDFLNSEQEKLNRLGNKALIISGRYNNIYEIPQLNSFIDDYILAERQIVVHDYYALFKGYLYKNYIRKNMYAGIHSKKRNTVIAVGSEALVRNDIFSKNYHFVTAPQPADKTERYLLSAIAGSGLVEYLSSSIRNAIISTYKEGGFDLLPDDVIWKIVTNYTDNKVNALNFSMVDNYSAGRVVKEEGSIGGYGQRDAKYVDSNGEFERITISLRNGYSNYITGDYLSENYKYDVSARLPLVNKAVMEQIISKDLEIASFDKKIYKDNAEITSVTMQFNFLDSNYVVIGKFGKHTPNGLIGEAPNYVIYYSNDQFYDVGDTECKGVKANTTIIDNSNEKKWQDGERVPYNNISLLNTDEIINCKSWSIGTEDGQLILGVNCKDYFIKDIYLCEMEEK